MNDVLELAAEAAASVAELGARAEHVGICVVDDAGVRQLCEELIPAMRPGSRSIEAAEHLGNRDCTGVTRQKNSVIVVED